MAKKIELSAKPDHFIGTGDHERISGNGGDDTISGRAGHDRLIGGEGDDRLSGGAGRDTLAGGAGDNVADGGRGLDVAVFHGTYADAVIHQEGDGWIIETTRGTTTTLNVERFRFADGAKTLGEMEPEPSVEDYFLTTAADDLAGTSLDDLIVGGTGTLNSNDVLDGGSSGNDLLRLGPGAIEAGATPALLSIELIEDLDGSGLNLAKATGVERVAAYATSASYINASLAATFAAASNVDQMVSIDYVDDLAGVSDTAAVATSLSAAATVDFDFGTDAAGIENIEIDVAAITIGASTVEVDADLGALKTVIVTGAGDAVIKSNGVSYLASGTLASVDASAATGDITTGLNGQASVTITFGAGDDTLAALGSEQGLAITLGAGDDRLALADLANIGDADEADFVDDIMTVAYFGASRDVIDLTAAGVSRAQLSDAQQIALEGAESLFAAVTAAAGFADADALIVFDYGNRTYAYLQDGEAGFDAGDGLIELGGVSAVDLNSTNFLV